MRGVGWLRSVPHTRQRVAISLARVPHSGHSRGGGLGAGMMDERFIAAGNGSRRCGNA
jgi:hypothetical protein